jgi:hypothetical protein
MSDTDILRALADCRAITDLIHRYCRAVDRFTCEVHEKKVLVQTGRRDRTDASYAVFNVA